MDQSSSPRGRDGQVTSSANDRSYKGQYKKDQMHGYGVWSGKNGDTFEGDFVFDCRDGKGRSVCGETGEVYEGDWKQSMRHGMGEMKKPDGETYQGAWEDDEMHGQGLCSFVGLRLVQTHYCHGGTSSSAPRARNPQ